MREAHEPRSGRIRGERRVERNRTLRPDTRHSATLITTAASIRISVSIVVVVVYVRRVVDETSAPPKADGARQRHARDRHRVVSASSAAADHARAIAIDAAVNISASHTDTAISRNTSTDDRCAMLICAVIRRRDRIGRGRSNAEQSVEAHANQARSDTAGSVRGRDQQVVNKVGSRRWTNGR